MKSFEDIIGEIDAKAASEYHIEDVDILALYALCMNELISKIGVAKQASNILETIFYAISKGDVIKEAALVMALERTKPRIASVRHNIFKRKH